MIGPAEIEDMRLDMLASERRGQVYDAVMAPLGRHWARRGSASVGSVERICALVYERSDGRCPSEWREVATEATRQAGYGIVWDGDEVAVLEATRALP